MPAAYGQRFRRTRSPQICSASHRPCARSNNRFPGSRRLANTILITGESGVGKEHVAQLIHRHARTSLDAPFVAISGGAVTESLLESELFGHEKGSFTGAAKARKGVFEQAHGGTLFLDEVGEMSLGMQVKLLRVIQERCIVRVGGETPIPVDVRLICATNRDLKKMVEENTFREDLYYRIHVIRLRIPPLRERKEDILWFANLFLKQCAQLSKETHYMSPVAEHALLDYDWPGNLRELKHSVERACILSHNPQLESDAFFDDGFMNSPAAWMPAKPPHPTGRWPVTCANANASLYFSHWNIISGISALPPLHSASAAKICGKK